MQGHISKTSLSRIGVAILVCALIALICVGILGYKKEPRGRDVTVLFLAGQSWWQGHSPYDVDFFVKMEQSIPDYPVYPFANPPQIAPLCLILGFSTLSVAKFLMTVINLFSLATFAMGCWALIKDRTDETSYLSAPFMKSLIAAAILGSSLTAAALWTGQTIPIVATAMVWGWYYSNKSTLISGVLLGIATIKPQLPLFILVWLLLERRFFILFLVLLTMLIGAIVPLSLHGPLVLWQEWTHALQVYQSSPYNQFSHENVFGLGSLLLALGIHVASPAAIGVVVGAGLTALLWYYRHHYARDDVLGILIALSVLLVYSRNYDFIATAPVLGSLLILSHSYASLAVALIVMANLVMPYVIFKNLGFPYDLLNHRFRIGILCMALIYLLWQRNSMYLAPKPK